MDSRILEYKRAVVYARVSTREQADKGVSIEAQLDECTLKAAELGAEVVRDFVDAGLSGRDDDRPAFKEMIEYCLSYTPDYLVMWSTSRFFRNTTLAGVYKLQLKRVGVEIVYASVNLQGDDDSVWLLEGFLQLVDEQYSRQNSSATKSSMVNNAKKGYFNGGVVPFGYDSAPAEDDPNRRRLVPNEPEARLVQKIFEMKLHQGMGARTISHQLNQAYQLNRGNNWTKSKIANILTSRRVIGQNVFNQKDRSTRRMRPESEWIIIDSHPPIVDKHIWEQTQQMLDTHRDNCTHDQRRSPFIFSSILKCEDCGAPMTIESATGRNKTYHYYVCKAARFEKAHAVQRYPADAIDQCLMDSICEEVFTMETLGEIIRDIKQHASEWETNAKKERRELRREIAVLNNKLNKIYEIMETHGKDTPNLGDLTKRLRGHLDAVKTDEKRLAELDPDNAPDIKINDRDLIAMRKMMRDIIEVSDPFSVKQFMRSFVESIVIGEGEAKVNYDPARLIKSAAPVRIKDRWLPGTNSKRTISVPLPGSALVGYAGRVKRPAYSNTSFHATGLDHV